MKPQNAIALVLTAALAMPAQAGSGTFEAIEEKYRDLRPDHGANIPRAGDWAVYTTPRFGTSVDYPQSLFLLLPAPENGDGQAFQTAEGRANFAIWGGFNALDETPTSRASDYLDSAGFDLVDEAVMLGAQGFRVVGTRAGGTVFHAEIFDGDVIHGFEAELAPEADPNLAPVLQQMMVSLRGADAAGTKSPSDLPVQDVTEGTPARAILLDAARAVIAPEIGQPIAFSVRVLRSYGPWAYLSGVPVQPDGRPLDWLQTPFAQGWRDDMMSDSVLVLFHDDGSGWRVLDWVIGPTDVYWVGWLLDHDLPRELFLPQSE